ncbi:MAG: Mur ligase family protein, partial [Chloroflexi bacterium]|nr:Mur ligase family protein [Chloroflexota bacterium]
NITNEPRDYHKTWENYRDAKAMLFRSLAGSYRKERTAKAAVLNADDNSRGVFDLLASVQADEYVVYATSEEGRRRADEHPDLRSRRWESIYARGVQHSTGGLRFTVVTPHGALPIEAP